MSISLSSIFSKGTERNDEIYTYQHRVYQHLATLQQVGVSITSSMELPAIYQLIVQKATELTNAECSTLLLLDQDNGVLRLYGAHGEPSGSLVQAFTLPLGVGLAGWAAQTGRPLFIPDAYQHPRWECSFDQFTHFHTRALLIAPLLRSPGGPALGVLEVRNKIGQPAFDEFDIEFFMAYAAQVTAVLMHQEAKNG
jgi:GAF domain-containing protein